MDEDQAQGEATVQKVNRCDPFQKIAPRCFYIQKTEQGVNEKYQC
ncbi:MAG TPA: hypothetical protein PKA70_01340 [Saprospiraceae bacterium]|nr:hypothetical protein [Saprospiraceae bacterium]